MNKAYKYRIIPSSKQEEMFSKKFGCVRFIYNHMLDDKISYYDETGKILKNTPAGYKKEYEFLKEVDSLALANTQINLQNEFSNFFRDKKIGFPEFKLKKDNHINYNNTFY